MAKHLDSHSQFGGLNLLFISTDSRTLLFQGKNGVWGFLWSLHHNPYLETPKLHMRPEVDSSCGSLGSLIHQNCRSWLVSPGAHTLPFWLLDAEAQTQARLRLQRFIASNSPHSPGSLERGPRDVACANTYFESWVSNEASVVTEIGRVMLHHALGLRLAEVLVGGGKAAGRQHDGWTFWKRPRQSRFQNTETSSGAHTKASLRLCQHVCYGGLMSSTRTQRAWQWEQRKKGGKTPPTFSPFRELMARRGTNAEAEIQRLLALHAVDFLG